MLSDDSVGGWKDRMVNAQDVYFFGREGDATNLVTDQHLSLTVYGRPDIVGREVCVTIGEETFKGVITSSDDNGNFEIAFKGKGE